MENRGEQPLSLTLATSGGTRITLELAPGQAMEVEAGDASVQVLLRDGRAEDLLLVKPSDAT